MRPSLCRRRKRGAEAQAIGRSRGGRTTKIHAAVDEKGRPRELIVRAGHRGDAPVGHWGTQTFVAGLRCDGHIAPWVVNAPMNRTIFDTYIETQLAPALRPGDGVIMDNLAAHKSLRADSIIRKAGAWMLFLPPYSPDLNPIEMAFSKLKAWLSSTAARTIDHLWKAIGSLCALFTQEECSNYFKAAGYGFN